MRNRELLRKAGIMFLSLATVVSGMVVDTKGNASQVLKDGVYEGVGQGFRDTVKMKITIVDGKITDISEVASSDDKGFWESAKNGIIPKIIEKQSADVDVISGATYSSKGIKEAVANALTLAAGASNIPSAGIFEGGKGTAEDPFLIASADQMMAFAASVTGTMDYEGYYVKLTKDVDLSNKVWSPIGGDEGKFAGTFDGNHHSVSGMTMKGDNGKALTVSLSHIGFFGALSGTARVKDLKLTKMDIDVASDGNNVVYAGGIAGSTSKRGEQYQGAIIDNCSVQGSMKIADTNQNIWAAGIVGMPICGAIINSSADIDIYADMDITKENYGGWLESGGIAGLNFSALISNCTATGSILADCFDSTKTELLAEKSQCAAGGISGLDCGTTLNCVSSVQLTVVHPSIYVGGITGMSEEKYANVYQSYYAEDVKYTVAGKAVVATGAGVVENGVVCDTTGFLTKDYNKVIEKVNACVSCPVELAQYGISTEELKALAKTAETTKVSLKKAKIKKASIANKKLVLSFAKVANAKKYQIAYRKGSKGAWTTKLVTKTDNKLSINAKKKSKYQVKVRAYNSKAVTGPWSLVKTIVSK